MASSNGVTDPPKETAVRFTDDDTELQEPDHGDQATASFSTSSTKNNANTEFKKQATVRIDPDAKESHPDPYYMASTTHFQRAMTRAHIAHPEAGFRERLAHIFESQRFHILIIALTMLDLVFIVSELCIESIAQQASCVLVEEHGGHVEAKIELSPQVELALEVLFWLSISILIIFCCEIIGKFLVYGPRFFIKHPFELLDAVVVVTSLVLDLVFHHTDEAIAIEILIFLRLWRIIRVMDGVAGEVQESMEMKLTPVEHEMETLKKELKEKDEEIARLKKAAGISESETAMTTANGTAGTAKETVVHQH